MMARIKVTMGPMWRARLPVTIRTSRTIPGVHTAMDDYMGNHKDFLVLVANGNQGGCGPPATAKSIVSVGYGSASQGPTNDGRIKPTVVAPGSITSADNDGTLGFFNSGYRGMEGTS